VKYIEDVRIISSKKEVIRSKPSLLQRKSVSLAIKQTFIFEMKKCLKNGTLDPSNRASAVVLNFF